MRDEFSTHLDEFLLMSTTASGATAEIDCGYLLFIKDFTVHLQHFKDFMRKNIIYQTQGLFYSHHLLPPWVLAFLLKYITMSTSEDNSIQTIRNMISLVSEKIPQELCVRLCKVIDEFSSLTTAAAPQTPSSASSTTNPNVDREHRRFCNEHHTFMNFMLQKREDTFFKFTRCQRLTALYEVCLAEEPPFVPKKWRKDKQHLLSHEEYLRHHESEVQRLRSEKDILFLRAGKFKSDLDEIDAELKNFVSSLPGPCNDTKNFIMKKWNDFISQDVQRINTKWNKNISNLELIFKRDKGQLRTTISQRFPPPANQQNQPIHPTPAQELCQQQYHHHRTLKDFEVRILAVLSMPTARTPRTTTMIAMNPGIR